MVYLKCPSCHTEGFTGSNCTICAYIDNKSEFKLIASPLEAYIESLILNAREKLLIISPYLKRQTLQWFKTILNRHACWPDNINIKFLTKFSFKDIIENASDIEAYKTLQELSIETRCIANLHAKLYISESGAIISSANFTPSGLSRNLEYGILVKATEELNRLTDYWTSHWLSAEILTESHIDNANADLEFVKNSIAYLNNRKKRLITCRKNTVGKRIKFDTKYEKKTYKMEDTKHLIRRRKQLPFVLSIQQNKGDANSSFDAIIKPDSNSEKEQITSSSNVTSKQNGTHDGLDVLPVIDSVQLNNKVIIGNEQNSKKEKGKLIISLSKTSIILNNYARKVLISERIELAYDRHTQTIRIKPVESGGLEIRKTKAFAKGFYNQFGINKRGKFLGKAGKDGIYVSIRNSNRIDTNDEVDFTGNISYEKKEILNKIKDNSSIGSKLNEYQKVDYDMMMEVTRKHNANIYKLVIVTNDEVNKIQIQCGEYIIYRSNKISYGRYGGLFKISMYDRKKISKIFFYDRADKLIYVSKFKLPGERKTYYV